MGFEPTTFCMASRRSSQLSYSRAGHDSSFAMRFPALGASHPVGRRWRSGLSYCHLLPIAPTPSPDQRRQAESRRGVPAASPPSPPILDPQEEPLVSPAALLSDVDQIVSVRRAERAWSCGPSRLRASRCTPRTAAASGASSTGSCSGAGRGAFEETQVVLQERGRLLWPPSPYLDRWQERPTSSWTSSACTSGCSSR